MNNVLSLIVLIRQNTLKIDNNYIIADYIINHLNDIENKSIKEVAEECHVSTSTVLKFCQLLGFKTYKTFKYSLLTTMRCRERQLIDKNKKFDIDSLIHHISTICQVDFNTQHFEEVLMQIIELMHQYKKVHIYGATYPLALSQSLIEDMALLGVSIYVQQTDFSDNYQIQDDGIHMIISYSGRFMDENRSFYNRIVNSHQPTILISRIQDNIGNIDYLLSLPISDSSHYDDIVLMIIYMYILVKYNDIYGKAS